MKPIRWAVCGLGRISEVFIEVVGGMPGCEVVGCISADPARAEAYRQRHGLRFAAGYGDIERIGAQADAVYICTNMHLHRPNALGFLSAGIPCLVEKAFSLDLAEAEEMVACAKKNRTPLMEAMWTVFLPAIGAARALAASGALGKPLCASGFFCGDATGNPASRVFRRELGGGSILDLMVYNIACAQLFFGRPTDMTVTGVLGGGVDLSCDAVLDYGGVRADLHASLTAKSPAEHFTVV
ncbi:MAG: Gfo/Idh/MocA family oxidoreductase, partial [Clostridiales bacterium]|nr:Gfo/Idh/MocA family oxidoreductase [Clostridiales bacterium]